MAAPHPPRRRDSPPALPDELVEEILLRLPPDEPAWLLRASLVCKTWGAAVCHRSFRRRLHELHRTPPVLGFFHNWYDDEVPQFVSTTASSFFVAIPYIRYWRPLDCRHGRAVFLSQDGSAEELLVWDPITGGERVVPVPAVYESSTKWKTPTAAVFCAADGCDHRDCHGGHFRLVFVCSVFLTSEEHDTSVCVYSSETGTWGEPTSVRGEFDMDFRDHSSVLVGSSLLYFLSDNGFIVEYDSARHDLTVFDAILIDFDFFDPMSLNLVLAEDGGLRVMHDLGDHLKLRAREASGGPDAPWVLSRVINLANLLQSVAVVGVDTIRRVVGFAEGANVIFVDTAVGVFTVELQSEQVRKVRDDRASSSLIPFVSFYTPMHRDKHQDPPPSIPSEEAGGEEGGEEEKTVDQAQELFDEGPYAIKEGDFVNACSQSCSRVPSYKEVSPECAGMEYGCALLQKPQEVDNPLDDVRKSVPNKESVTGADNKVDAGNYLS